MLARVGEGVGRPWGLARRSPLVHFFDLSPENFYVREFCNYLWGARRRASRGAGGDREGAMLGAAVCYRRGIDGVSLGDQAGGLGGSTRVV